MAKADEAKADAPCCANCRFFAVQDGRRRTGRCHRHPPHPGAGAVVWMEGDWPGVRAEGWCGEHQRVADTDAAAAATDRQPAQRSRR